jgi:hypothetical protein
MPGIVYEFYGIFLIVVLVLDMVTAFVGFTIVNPVCRPLDVSGQVCGSSGGDDLPSVGYKSLEEGISAGHFGFANHFWADGPDTP